jgi:hypothetical protein
VKAAEKAKKLQKLQEDTLEQIDYIENKGGHQSIEDVLDEGLPDKTKK